MMEPLVARKAVWNGTSHTFDPVTYDYTFLDSLAQTTHGLGMDLYTIGPVYWLPAWAAYGNRFTYDPGTPAFAFDSQKFKAKLWEYVQNVMTRYVYTDSQKGIRFWTVPSEMLRDDDTPIGDFSSILKWYYELYMSPALRWSNTYYHSYYHPWFQLSDHGTDLVALANDFKDLYRLASSYVPGVDNDTLLVYDDYGYEFRYSGPAATKQELLKYRRALAMADAFAGSTCSGPDCSPTSPAQSPPYALNVKCLAGTDGGSVNVAFDSTNGTASPGTPYQNLSVGATSVTLTATPGTGWYFIRWEGSIYDSSRSTTLSFSMNGNKNIIAVFSQIQNPSGASLDSTTAPLDAFALQMHLTAWSVMTYDTSYSGGLPFIGLPNGAASPSADHFRLNVDQLRNLRESVKGLANEGLNATPSRAYQVIISQMDVRIGIPQDSSGTFSSEQDGLSEHLTHDGAFIWAGCDPASGNPSVSTLDLRCRWQGKAYEAMLDACLAVPQLRGILFWGIEDEYSWMDGANGWAGAPAYPNWKAPFQNDGSSQPCLFGRNLATPIAQRETFYPKPAYYGVRNAMLNYFGQAYKVMDSDYPPTHNPPPKELVRFVTNGNVLVMNENMSIDQTVHTGCASINTTSARLVVKNTGGVPVAAVAADGQLYLAGDVSEDLPTPVQPLVSGPAFKITSGKASNVVILIDQGGNLRIAGHLYVEGLPYDLRGYEDGRTLGSLPEDAYFAS